MSANLTAAQSLEGIDLPNRWHVERRIARPPGSTGGLFSERYIVSNGASSSAFLKALDYSEALRSPHTPLVLQAMTNAFLYEQQLLERCARARMTHVVRALESGSTEVPGFGPLSKVDYIIFEWADSDIRHARDHRDPIDKAWSLRALHHVAVGLWQLHGAGITHQDLKPSNVLVFEGSLSKIADLGRAAQEGIQAPHEELVIAGDLAYAPPELLYGEVDSNLANRRRATDLYSLGSLGMFLYAGLGTTAALAKELPHQLIWGNHPGTYADVLPYVREAFARSLGHLADVLDQESRDPIIAIVRELCDPDPTRRGDPWARNRAGHPYSLERYVSRLDLLARRAELGLRSLRK